MTPWCDTTHMLLVQHTNTVATDFLNLFLDSFFPFRSGKCSYTYFAWYTKDHANIMILHWTVINSSRANPGRSEKIKLNFYFHTSLWCIKRFYEGLKDLYKKFWGTTKKCENKNKNLIFIFIQLSEMHGTGRGLIQAVWELFNSSRNHVSWIILRRQNVVRKTLLQLRNFRSNLAKNLHF